MTSSDGSPRRLAARRVTTRWRPLAAVFALSLAVAACGSATNTTSPTLAPQDSSSSSDDTAGAEAAETAEAPEAQAPETAEAEGDDEVASDEVAAPILNLFPDIDVTNIADGATVNLASELGGGAKATLLWFFAPH